MKKNKVKIILYCGIWGFALMLVLFGFAFFKWQSQKEIVVKNLKSFSDELNISYTKQNNKPVKIYDQNQFIIGEFYLKNPHPIRKENLHRHKNLVWAVLASEDREFDTHGGISYSAIIRAIVRNIISFKVAQGGSTLTQQLAKLSLNLEGRNIFNKIVELYCSFYIEDNFDKDTILVMYLNRVYMGNSNTGMEDASRFYFNKSASALDQAEAAMLAGIIQAPSVFNPMRSLNIALRKQNTILKIMNEYPGLQYRPSATSKPVKTLNVDKMIRRFKALYHVQQAVIFKKTILISDIGTRGYDKDFIINKAKDFNRTIRAFILDQFDSETVKNMGLSVYTTLDISKQQFAEKAFAATMVGIEKQLEKRKALFLKKRNKKEAKRENEIIRTMNGSLVSINPTNGYVEALIGSYRFSSIYKLNRAEQARRQPGSAIKALVYALAFHKRIIHPASIVKDEKLQGYSPRNWYGHYKGNLPAIRALALSVNTIPVKLLKEMRIDFFIDKLAEVLQKDPDEIEYRFQRNLSLALGSGEVTPMELAQIYGTIANLGTPIQPVKILKIKDKDNNVLYEYEPNELEPVIDPVACAMTLKSLEAVLSKIGTMNFPTEYAKAGKTGTVQSPKGIRKKWGGREGIRDVWFAGILPQLVTTIWIGNDTGAPFKGSGSGTAGRVFRSYAKQLTTSSQGSKYKKKTLVNNLTEDHTKVDLCVDTGLQHMPEIECKYVFKEQIFYSDQLPEKPEIIEPVDESIDETYPSTNITDIDTTDKIEPSKIEIVTSTDKKNESESVELPEPDNNDEDEDEQPQ